jgi:CheY-like chemotaxis protein
MGRKTWDESKMTADREVFERFQPSSHIAKAWWEDDEIVTMPAANRPLRVLIVDDNRDLAYMMSGLIQKCGHEVQIAYDGPTALELSAEFHPDVAFVDIALPKMDGFCLARELRVPGVLNDSLLIAVTGFADERHRALGMKAGFDHYIAKPVAFRTLAEILLVARNRLVRSVKERDEAREAIDASACC